MTSIITAARQQVNDQGVRLGLPILCILKYLLNQDFWRKSVHCSKSTEAFTFLESKFVNYLVYELELVQVSKCTLILQDSNEREVADSSTTTFEVYFIEVCLNVCCYNTIFMWEQVYKAYNFFWMCALKESFNIGVLLKYVLLWSRFTVAQLYKLPFY